MSAPVALAPVLRQGARWIVLSALVGAGLAAGFTWMQPPRYQISAELRLLRPPDPALVEWGLPVDLAGVQSLFFGQAVRTALLASDVPAGFGVEARAPEAAQRWAELYSGTLTVAGSKNPTSVHVLALDSSPERGARLLDAAIGAARGVHQRELRAALEAAQAQVQATQAATLAELRGLVAHLERARQAERETRQAAALRAARHWRVQAARQSAAGADEAASLARRATEQAELEAARLAYADLAWTSLAATRLDVERQVLLESYGQQARRASLVRDALVALPEPWVVVTRERPAHRVPARAQLPILLWGLAAAAGALLLLLARAGRGAA